MKLPTPIGPFRGLAPRVIIATTPRMDPEKAAEYERLRRQVSPHPLDPPPWPTLVALPIRRPPDPPRRPPGPPGARPRPRRGYVRGYLGRV